MYGWRGDVAESDTFDFIKTSSYPVPFLKRNRGAAPEASTLFNIFIAALFLYNVFIENGKLKLNICGLKVNSVGLAKPDDPGC